MQYLRNINSQPQRAIKLTHFKGQDAEIFEGLGFGSVTEGFHEQGNAGVIGDALVIPPSLPKRMRTIITL
ncbi:hypothetical protein [Alteromonas sp. a30]|uniref:hypothetical protein n=1 Tax=Alteromonas sp. a30 TaxID=2730917 RepID=UPI002280F041|nr:hypothetical protein [Alteromonas sp. a30]MCY7296339.1 hypothetical protein [Alteromonas sp. a30]